MHSGAASTHRLHPNPLPTLDRVTPPAVATPRINRAMWL